jgi:pimeloyl-ACP methyl ester carboxylesterase
LVLIPGGSHILPLEEREQVGQVLREFLTGL